MMEAAAVALRTYLLPVTSTRAFRIGAFVFLLAVAVVGLGAMIKPVAEFLAQASLEALRRGTILPGVPLAALLLSEIPLRDGIRHRTLLYALLGPVPRPLLAATRTLATAVLTAAGLSAYLILVRIAHGGGESPLSGELLAIWLGSACYVGLFGLFHLVSRRGLLVGLAFYGLLDDPLGRLPFALRVFSPSFHVRVLAQQESMFELPIPLTPPDASPVTAALVLAAMAAFFMGLTAWLFSRKPLGELC